MKKLVHYILIAIMFHWNVSVFADDGASNEGTQAFLDTGSAGASAVKGEALLQEPLRVRTQGLISATAPAHFGGLGGRRMYSTSR